MNSRKTYGIVDAAVNSCCELWGRKDKDREDVDGVGKKFKQTTNNNHWNCRFRSDNTCGHITEQHSIKFVEYTLLQRKSGILSAKIRNFFEKLTVDAFFEKRFAIIGTNRMCLIDKVIVEVITQ